MKRQTTNTLIEDLRLEVGEHFIVGDEDDPLYFEVVYVGIKEENGFIYDLIRNVSPVIVMEPRRDQILPPSAVLDLFVGEAVDKAAEDLGMNREAILRKGTRRPTS